ALVHHLRGVEIARALERPPETVRSQLHRGLELLRKALPRGLAVPALALAATGAFAGRGLAAVRAAVHAQALAQQAALAASTGATGTTAGALGFGAWIGGTVLMQKIVLGVAGALGAALLLWTLWPRPAADGRAPLAQAGGIEPANASSDK